MDSEEFRELRNRFLLGLLIVGVFSFLLIFLLSSKLGNYDSKVLKGLNGKKTFFVLLTNSKNCSNCDNYLKKIDKFDVVYYNYDLSKENDYTDILKRIGLSSDVVELPGVIYIENGEMIANMMGIDDDEVFDEFIKRYS